MEINIKISSKRLKLGRIIAAQKGDLEAARDMIAANMLGPDGNYLPMSEAISILDGVDIETLNESILPQFMEAMEVVRRDALPLRNSGR
jgi:hypothetical protein